MLPPCDRQQHNRQHHYDDIGPERNASISRSEVPGDHHLVDVPHGVTKQCGGRHADRRRLERETGSERDAGRDPEGTGAVACNFDAMLDTWIVTALNSLDAMIRMCAAHSAWRRPRVRVTAGCHNVSRTADRAD